MIGAARQAGRDSDFKVEHVLQKATSHDWQGLKARWCPGQCATYYFSFLPSAAFLKTSTHFSKYSTQTGFLQEGRKERSSQ